MPRSRIAISDVHAAELRPGDGMLRCAVAGGDREMVIDDIAMRSEGGESVLLFSGSTYALDPARGGERILRPVIGEDCWISPIDGRVARVIHS